MIYDTFVFFNELEILELRLREMDMVADRFVLVEAPVTFSGNPKPLYYAENRARFSPWKDRIIHVVVNDMPDGDDAWKREHHQRECIRRGLADVKPDDTVIMSDADEIPCAATLRDVYRPGMPSVLAMQMKSYFYFFNYRYRWDMFYGKVLSGDVVLGGASFRHLRFSQMIQDAVLRDAGWHMSYMGGLDRVKVKVKSTSHWNEPEVEPMLKKYEAQEPIVAESGKLQKVAIAEHSHPIDVVRREALWRERGFIHD